MDLATLQSGGSYSRRSPADRQLSLADVFPSVRSRIDPDPTVSILPDKAIDQRWCAVGRLGNADRAGSDSECCDASLGSPDDYTPDRLPAPRQQTLKSQESDGNGPWQVVTRCRSGRKQQQSPAVAPVGRSGARVKHGTRAKSTSARQMPDSRSAGHGVSGQKQRLQVDPGSLSPRLYWPACTKSFARLSGVDWEFFHTCQMKYQQYLQINVTEGDFLRFHHMMTKGPQAICAADDVAFLACPFKVLLSDYGLSSDAVLLSLLFERTVPGLLRALGDRFVNGLAGVDRKHEELFTAVTELLARICQEDECWQDRLGWQKLSMRNRCQLFSCLAFFFKHGNKIDLTRNLHQQVGGPWLERYYYATVKKLSRANVRSDPDVQLRDLKASIRAVFYWLADRFLVTRRFDERRRLIVCYAGIAESVTETLERLDLQPNESLFGVWRAVAQWSFYFRNHLRLHLGFDRAIALLNGQLQQIHRWSELEGLAFELRLTLLGVVLMKCEELLFKRDSTLFSRAWREHKNLLVSLLARCNQFLGKYQAPFAVDNQSDCATRKEMARLEVLLVESKFYRLDCEIRKPTRQRLEKNLKICREAFAEGWALSCHHREIGTLELAKWCFLAGEHDEAVRCLVEACFNNVKLSWKKADLLANHGAYQAAIDEFCRVKSLMTDSDEADQPNRNEVDDRIAMTQLRWYQAEHDTDHLISAYRLSVDLLGRCHIPDRKRFEGVLSRVVSAMKNSGLRFEDFVEQTSVLSYLVKEGCSIRSWRHFVDLLHIRHKLGLTDANTVQMVAGEIGGKRRPYLDLGKMS